MKRRKKFERRKMKLKQRKRVKSEGWRTGKNAGGRKKAGRKIARLQASGEERRAESSSRQAIVGVGGEFASLEKEAGGGLRKGWRQARKQRITMFLDADVLAWFKEKPRYQTRINRALWRVMKKEKGEAVELGELPRRLKAR
jgi:uncharacterized protein (DUF4415 family)